MHFLWHGCMSKTQIFFWHATDIHMHRYTNTCTHICRDTSTYRYRHMHKDIHKHTCKHTQTHMHIYLHTQTHIHILQVNSACSFISSCHLPNELRFPWTYFFTYTNRHTYITGQFCLLILYLVAICQMSSGSHGPIFYIHKQTYIYYKSILPAHFIFSCYLPNELRSPWTYF